VTGAVAEPLELSLADLRGLPLAAAAVVLECAGHRRTELDPPVDGVPWGAGAVSQGRWAGASLADVLERARPAAGAAHVVFRGADGDGADVFARALPLDRARRDSVLLAWELDGAEIPLEHGGPLRAVVPGRYAVDSVKWLGRIEVVSEPFRGRFQEEDYRLFGAAGVPDGAPLGELPVSSLVTSPEEGDDVAAGTVRVAGVAWGGHGGVTRVGIRVDDGPWHEADLDDGLGPHAFRPFEATVALEPGPHLLASRATDRAGVSQPERPLWNARGYANSSVHRVAVHVAARA
jgi:DMSO/TMAO reductase YedYZ molybdopterin-dependent catalytic subunit